MKYQNLSLLFVKFKYQFNTFLSTSEKLIKVIFVGAILILQPVAPVGFAGYGNPNYYYFTIPIQMLPAASVHEPTSSISTVLLSI